MQSSAPRLRIPRDVWIGLAAFVLGAWYWRAAGDIAISPLDGIVNASVLPRMLAVAMMLFSVLLAMRALLVEYLFVRAARQRAGADTPQRPEAEGMNFSVRQHIKAAGVVVIGVVYLLVLPWLGYVPSAALLIAATAVYIGARAGLYTFGVAVAVAVIFYLLFVRLLGIPLPAGLWPALLG
jgi:uncharacterized membrane protein